MDDWKDGEIVDVQEDTRPWWKDRYVVIDWRIVGLTALLGLPALLLALLRQ